MKRLWNWLWHAAPRPLLIGLIVGLCVVIVGGYHGFMDYTNRTEFCISCHEMKDNSYAEYKDSIHFHNSSGVRAGCADCHVPKGFVPKIVRKIFAAKDVWHNLLGTIDTPEKFENHRLVMAQDVWTYMRESGSRECKTCHSYEAMHAVKQGPRAQRVMGVAAKTDQSCIDCHKGIAHKLPRFDKIYAGWMQAFHEGLNKEIKPSQTVYSAGRVVVHAATDTDSDVLASLPPLMKMKIKAREEDWVQIDLADQKTGWISLSQPLSAQKEPIEDMARQLWQTDCQICHARPKIEEYNATQWEEHLQAMAKFTYLNAEQQQLVLKFLQNQVTP